MDNNSPDSKLASASASIGSNPQLRFGKIEDLSRRVGAAVAAARKFLFSKQHEDVYWCGELEADTTLESDYILLHTLLGTGNQERFQKCPNYILRHQYEDGYWCGELEADTTLESDYILLHTLLGTGNQERFQKCANYILRHQNEDGGWPIYNGGPSNISASVKAYFGLKLAGYKP